MYKNIFKLKLLVNYISISMFSSLNRIFLHPPAFRSRHFVTSTLQAKESSDSNVNKKESARMRQFHEKLKLQPIPRVPPKERFVDLVLVETDPSSGELITDSEKDPTKWGDWQNRGRVSDF